MVAFYRKDLARYGAVDPVPRTGSAVGTPTRQRRMGSACDSDDGGKGHTENDNELGELRTGSKLHQHVVSIDHEGAGTEVRPGGARSCRAKWETEIGSNERWLWSIAEGDLSLAQDTAARLWTRRLAQLSIFGVAVVCSTSGSERKQTGTHNSKNNTEILVAPE